MQNILTAGDLSAKIKQKREEDAELIRSFVLREQEKLLNAMREMHKLTLDKMLSDIRGSLNGRFGDLVILSAQDAQSVEKMLNRHQQKLNKILTSHYSKIFHLTIQIETLSNQIAKYLPILQKMSKMMENESQMNPELASKSPNLTNYAILRTAKLKTLGNIGSSLSHTYRTRPTPNADPARAGQNCHSVENSDLAMARIKARLPEKRRKDAVLAIEYFIGSSPEAFQDNKAHMAYFEDALAWLKQQHGADNVVASSLHFDQTTPHMVAYVVPLDGAGKLNAKKFLGGRQVLSAMQTDFAKKVGEKHGLERGIERSTATHTTIKEWYGALNMKKTGAA